MNSNESFSDQITRVVSAWPGVSTGVGSRGEWAFKVNRKEIGHLHGSHVAHLFFTKEVWSELHAAGRITEHPVFPGKIGPAARRLENAEDVSDVIELMRLNYDRRTAATATTTR
jgi:hypothetical protein